MKDYSIKMSSNDMGRCGKPKHWTKLAEMCYERGCVCEGCYYAGLDNFGMGCQVKASVLESVKLYGIPFERTKVVIDD